MQTVIGFDAFVNALWPFKTELQNQCIWPDDDDIPDIFDSEIDGLLYWMAERNYNMECWMETVGLWIDHDAREIHYDPKYFPQIHAMTKRIFDEYESGAMDDDENSIWNEFGLRGDDDVDYNGGYIENFLTLLELIESHA